MLSIIIAIIIFLLAGAAAGWFAVPYLAKLIKEQLPSEWQQSGLQSPKARRAAAIACAIACGLCALLFWGQSIALAIINALATIALICIAFSDFCHYIIFDRFQLAFGVLAVAKLVCSLLGLCNQPGFWVDSAFGFAAGLMLYGGVAIIGSKILNKDAMGWGDVKLAACSGLFLGWQNFLLSTLASAVIGSVILLVLAKKRGDEKHKEYPYAPFMVIGNLLAIFAGDAIISFYTSLCGLG